MLKSSLCGYSNVYVLVKGTLLVIGAGDDTAEIQADKRNKEVIFKNCAPVRECINNKKYTDR